MTPEAVVAIGQQALQVIVLLSAPLLLSALLVGLFIAAYSMSKETPWASGRAFE